MFTNEPTDLSKLDETISDAHAHLKDIDEASPEYAHIVDQLEKLYRIRVNCIKPEPEVQKDAVDKDKVRLKDWIPVISTIGGILVIVAFEAAGHSVTSKALGFVRK